MSGLANRGSRALLASAAMGWASALAAQPAVEAGSGAGPAEASSTSGPREEGAPSTEPAPGASASTEPGSTEPAATEPDATEPTPGAGEPRAGSAPADGAASAPLGTPSSAPRGAGSQATPTPRTDERTSEPAPRARSERPPREERSGLRGSGHAPKGAIRVGVLMGAAASDDLARFSLGASFGYAPVSGVLPGVRAVGMFGDVQGGELAPQLELTLPFDLPVGPFVVGEGGYRWEKWPEPYPRLQGPVAGFGGGVYLGPPTASVKVQLGWMWRRYFPDGYDALDISGAIVAVAFNF